MKQIKGKKRKQTSHVQNEMLTLRTPVSFPTICFIFAHLYHATWQILPIAPHVVLMHITLTQLQRQHFPCMTCSRVLPGARSTSLYDCDYATPWSSSCGSQKYSMRHCLLGVRCSATCMYGICVRYGSLSYRYLQMVCFLATATHVAYLLI